MKRLPMRKIREALRLRADGFSGRQVAQSLSLGRATIFDYFRRADVEGLIWPLPVGLSDGDLERALFPRSVGDLRGDHPQPDWAYVHAELRRKGVTLSLLWEEYRGVHPDGYGYSRYCELYTRWEGKLSPVMRQRHPAGERLFVDYAGPTVDVVCAKTGEVRAAQIFVATLGASNYTYVEASWTQSLPDWISSHVRAFEFFGGVAARVGPNTEAFVEVVMRSRRHPEQGYRACMGVIRLAKTFGPDRLEAACERAAEINARSYSSLHSILKNGLDRNPRRRATDEPAITHSNIRGAGYFH